MHVLGVLHLGKGTTLGASLACRSGLARAAAEHHGRRRTVKFRNGHHDGALDREEAALGFTPLIERLKLDRVRGDIRNIQARKHLLGSAGIVVGWPTYQGEPR